MKQRRGGAAGAALSTEFSSSRSGGTSNDRSRVRPSSPGRDLRDPDHFRTKVVSPAVIAMFALGIGANTAIFSLIDSVLFSLSPYDSPIESVTVELSWTNTGQGTPASLAPDFRDWRQQNHVFDSMAFHAGREARVVANGTPIFASVQWSRLTSSMCWAFTRRQDGGGQRRRKGIRSRS